MNAERVLSEWQIIRELAEQLCHRLTRKVIAHLQRMPGYFQLVGEDTELRDTWDEICVQVQYEQSFYWEAYEETVRQLVVAYVENLSDYEREAIWLQTPGGYDWKYDDEA